MLGHLPERVNDNMLRVIGAYLLAVIVGYVAAAAATTQSVMSSLADMGVAVPLTVRLVTTAQDVMGMTSSYLPIIAVAFAIAFPVAALVLRWRPDWRWFGYPVAGGIAILVVHLALELTFGFSPVAATRTLAGLTVQALCGALGGWVFLRACPVPARS